MCQLVNDSFSDARRDWGWYKDDRGVFVGVSWREAEIEEFLVDSGCSKTLIDARGGGRKLTGAVKSDSFVQGFDKTSSHHPWPATEPVLLVCPSKLVVAHKVGARIFHTRQAFA